MLNNRCAAAVVFRGDMMGRNRRKNRRRSTEPADQWFRGPCSCGRVLRFRFVGAAWSLLAFDPQSGDWTVVEDRRCPSCGQSFAELDADELKDRFCPGGMAQ